VSLARARGLGYASNYLHMPLSLALCGVSKFERAGALADSVVEHFQALGSTGLNLALAYETRARVALAADDESGFEHYATLSAEQWPADSKRLLGASHGRQARKRAGDNARQADVAASAWGTASDRGSRSGSCLTVCREGQANSRQGRIDNERRRRRPLRASIDSSVSTQDE
jgi:hypothetical protein